MTYFKTVFILVALQLNDDSVITFMSYESTKVDCRLWLNVPLEHFCQPSVTPSGRYAKNYLY